MPFTNKGESSSRNFLIAITLLMFFMFGYEHFFGNKKQEQQEVASEQPQIKDQEVSFPEFGSLDSSAQKILIEDAMKKYSRISIENNHISGSIDLKGAIIDSIILKNYKDSVEDNSQNVRLLTPKDTESQFFYVVSYDDKTNNEKISDKTFWIKIFSKKEDSAVVLKTRTKNGLTVERTVTLDDGYMISVVDRITNTSNVNVKLSAQSDLVRSNPKHDNQAVVHAGIVGNIQNRIEETKYEDIELKPTALTDCGWLGYTDIYWLCSVINKGKDSVISYSKIGKDSYRISTIKQSEINLSPGLTTELSYAIFAGPKDIRILEKYRDEHDLDKFEMSINFGWFFMITKPLIQLIDLLAGVFPNMGLVILMLTLMFKIITYPLTKKSFTSAAKMKEIQPKVAAVQKLYAHDKIRMNQEMIALYKKEKVSPMSGCLPMLLQAPIFFCLYKVFFISIEMRHAPLFGWIRDLSAPDSSYIFNLFGLIDWNLPGFLQIGVWPLIMGVTMLLQQKLSSSGGTKKVEKAPEQKMQENIMLIMPIMFTYICSSFPVAVVVYWTITNLFGILQQHYTNRKLGKR
ncbi:MAG: membrane protein insertase YidC [Holosporales bacterium]|jgi:YidC/Oxa1 family membrane protein insertase|nr:membrane protein insertase YidC [Holosporales bacterium]